MIRDLPGGMTAVIEMVRAFKSRGVRVFWTDLAWDDGTRRDAANGGEWYKTLVDLVIQTGADGINGDTMNGVSVAESGGGGGCGGGFGNVCCGCGGGYGGGGGGFGNLFVVGFGKLVVVVVVVVVVMVVALVIWLWLWLWSWS